MRHGRWREEGTRWRASGQFSSLRARVLPSTELIASPWPFISLLTLGGPSTVCVRSDVETQKTADDDVPTPHIFVVLCSLEVIVAVFSSVHSSLLFIIIFQEKISITIRDHPL
jgi:hypothetical protein